MTELLAAFALAPDVLGICERDGTIVDANRGLGVLGRSDLIGKRLDQVVTPACASLLQAALETFDGSTRVDIAVAMADGNDRWFQLAIAPLAGSRTRLALVASDITARKATEDRLRRAESMMTDTQGTAHLGTWEWDPALPHATWSAELYNIYGLAPETYTPSYEAYLTKVHPDDRAHVIAATNQVFTTHEPYSHDERIFRPDGTVRYLHTWAHAILDGQGKLHRLIGVCQDITDRKLAELELARHASELAHSNARLVREAGERAKVEKLLRRSQKLEAIGRLTGGIAHDFNNVLGVVIGYTSIMYRRLAPGSPDREYLTEIMNAVERAGRMTGQLLAFSSDHAIARGPIELDRVVQDLAQLLRRLMGERIELALELFDSRRPPDEDGLIVDANGSQIEQVLMNLAVNARDAMPDGGTLKIATSRITLGAGEDVPPGEYVLLEVSDTGTGMSEDIQIQIFDPFFTTKEPGRGTGLGLSTVYGIVKQSGGSITVTSEPMRGTRFAIALPRVAPQPTAGAGEIAPARGGTETILLVEDEAALRAVLRHALESFGYTVLEASDAITACQLADDHGGTIDLVLTDVVMPGLGGREVVERLHAMRPGMRALYMSGYTADVVLRQGVIEGKVELLRKPFTADELARRLRGILG